MENEIDPFAIPMIFFRVGWMTSYMGKTSSDEIIGGGSYVQKHGFGHEVFNFLQFRDRMFGYVSPPGKSRKLTIGKINGVKQQESVDDVLVVWVATDPEARGGYVVGWYKNATVFESAQPAPAGSNRSFQGETCDYYATAASKDTVLLPPNERVFFYT